MSDVLRADRVTKRFGGLVAVSSVDFTIPAQGIVSLIGPNGAGKTTFFNIIAGIYDPTAGVIEFQGQKMIAHSQRAWLEPVFWVLPGAIAGLITVLLAVAGTAEGELIIGIFVTVLLLLLFLVIGAIRPPSYQRLLARVGIFRSARPNDMVVAGLGRTFQNIRLFPNMTALENVLVGMHARLKTTWIDALFSTPRDRSRGGVVARARPTSCSSSPDSRARTTSWPRTCRTATSAGSRSPGRSRPTRSSSCSTSRPPG